MKKILTLLLVAGAFTNVQAQSREESRDVILGGGNNDGNYPTSPNRYPSGNNRQYEVDQVNRDYDARVQSIRNNPYLSSQAKERAIRQLEKDRQARLRQIGNVNNGSYGNNEDCINKSKGNNGKHKGWTKGKGNKHG